MSLRVEAAKAIVGLRPSFSAHVSGFPARGATSTRVCGFHEGKPHEVRQRQKTRQEIRRTLGRTWGTRLSIPRLI
jgi:hypothetical protein